MARSNDATASSNSITLIAVVLAIAALYFGRQIFIPLALAVVLTFLLTPFVALLEKIRFGRVPSVILVLALSLTLVGLMTWGVATQLVDIMVQFPDYKANLDDKIKLLHATKSTSLSKATATIEDLNKELAAVPGEISSGHLQDKQEKAAARPVRPIQVQMAERPNSFLADLRDLLGPLAGPAETAAIVVIFALFMLIKREDVRNRAIRLAGRGQLNRVTQALDDAGRRLSKFLLMQMLVNASYGTLFGVGLYFLGVPHALLWGVFTAVMRFVPYIGTLIAAALPVAMALAVFPGLHQAAIAFGIFMVLELLVSNVVEPLLYGAHTGISSLAILVAAVFWTTIWGPVGLILSTPLTVCLVVLGRHVPQLHFLEVVLGDEPVLLPEQCFYQRLLAMDQDEARQIAEAHLHANSLESLYEAVILPALKSAEQDHLKQDLDDGSRRFIVRTVKEIVDDLGEQYAENVEPTEPAIFNPAETLRSRAKVACIPASSGSDEIVATMIAHLLRQAGLHASDFLAGPASETVQALARYKCTVACVSSISASSVGEARTLCKRLRVSAAGVRIVMGLWNFESATGRQRIGPGCAGAVVTTVSEALAEIRRLGDPNADHTVVEPASENQTAGKNNFETIGADR